MLKKIEAVNKRKTTGVRFTKKYNFSFSTFSTYDNSNLTHKDFASGISLMLPVAVIKY